MQSAMDSASSPEDRRRPTTEASLPGELGCRMSGRSRQQKQLSHIRNGSNGSTSSEWDPDDVPSNAKTEEDGGGLELRSSRSSPNGKKRKADSPASSDSSDWDPDGADVASNASSPTMSSPAIKAEMDESHQEELSVASHVNQLQRDNFTKPPERIRYEMLGAPHQRVTELACISIVSFSENVSSSGHHFPFSSSIYVILLSVHFLVKQQRHYEIIHCW